MRELDSTDLYKMMYNLPKGKAFIVDTQDIHNAIKQLLNFTGLDMMGSLRFSDVEEFIKTYSKNLDLRITHDEMNGRMKFYKPEL